MTSARLLSTHSPLTCLQDGTHSSCVMKGHAGVISPSLPSARARAIQSKSRKTLPAAHLTSAPENIFLWRRRTSVVASSALATISFNTAEVASVLRCESKYFATDVTRFIQVHMPTHQHPHTPTTLSPVHKWTWCTHTRTQTRAHAYSRAYIQLFVCGIG